MQFRGKVYNILREAIASVPVIDCHEHTLGPLHCAASPKEPIAALIQGYVLSDLQSVGAEKDTAMLVDENIPTEKKWPKFREYWRLTEHTAYARVTKFIMRDVYGEEKMTLAALKRIAGKIPDLKDEKVYFDILERAGIRCRLVNILDSPKAYIQGKHKLPKCDRMLVPLPEFHSGARSFDGVQRIAGFINRAVTSLDEYLDCCLEIFKVMKKRGTIGMKDQSAYGREIRFDNATRADAEQVFNFFMEDPRRSIGWPEAKPLDDFLFHSFMRMARDLDWPVQIHTGHMAGVRNDIAKTNAVLLTSVLELHREVNFDIFHANWPYAGEVLYLAKNYPNVALDLCWAHIIDAYYCRHLLCDALTSVPHSKIHGFGGDYGDAPHYSAAHLEIARDNIAEALAEMIDRQWIDLGEAKQIAADWLFNNPNRFFKLGFTPVTLK